MLYNLRGCNGAGKTYAVKTGILDKHSYKYIVDPALQEVVATSVPDLDLYIQGMYREDLGTGGVDWYIAGNGGSKKTLDDLEQCLLDLHDTGKKVLFEGFMVSGSIARWVEFAKKVPTTFLCLDTPLEVCEAHILERRRRKGNTKPFATDNLKASHRQCWNNYRALEREGCNLVWIDHTKAPEALYDEIRSVPTL